ncbi:MAG: helix-turn-helix transcriptional regulator, partial [Promicromonosporaceae bacterium]|nr:helix-turn-helix transcriptional regulator [Promicromonosporaceae bacterium]
VDTFLVYLLDHCPDPDSLPPLRGIEEPDTRNAMGFVTIELLLARGRSEEALEALQAVNPEEGPFSRTFAATEAYALLLENRLDEALQLALAQLHQARLEHEIEGITGAAYVASQVYLLRGRHGELRGLLGSVLSSGVLSALMRPQMVALTSMAAYAAVEEGRITTARSMAAQAADIGAYPGPFPFSSPTAALAALDGVDLPPAAARALAAERLWSEATEHLGRGYLLSGFVCGLLALSEEPTAARAEVLLTAAKQIPSPLIEEFTDFIEALGSGDHEGQLQVANRHAEAGLIWSATKAYAVALAAMRAAGSAGQAAEAHEEARRRLSVWGDEATAGLRSAADGAELTAREDEIARLAASGLSNQEIARRLLISVRTVENHLHRVFRKLGVDNRTEMSRVLNV